MPTPTTTHRSDMIDRIMHDYAAVAARLPEAAVTRDTRARDA